MHKFKNDLWSTLLKNLNTHSKESIYYGSEEHDLVNVKKDFSFPYKLKEPKFEVEKESSYLYQIKIEDLKLCNERNSKEGFFVNYNGDSDNIGLKENFVNGECLFTPRNESDESVVLKNYFKKKMLYKRRYSEPLLSFSKNGLTPYSNLQKENNFEMSPMKENMNNYYKYNESDNEEFNAGNEDDMDVMQSYYSPERENNCNINSIKKFNLNSSPSTDNLNINYCSFQENSTFFNNDPSLNDFHPYYLSCQENENFYKRKDSVQDELMLFKNENSPVKNKIAPVIEKSTSDVIKIDENETHSSHLCEITIIEPAKEVTPPVLYNIETNIFNNYLFDPLKNYGKRECFFKSDFKIDLTAIREGRDKRTTCMIKNIPNKYTQSMLIEMIDESHRGKYDFVYLRMDFKNKCNVGYAFINFLDHKTIPSFYKKINGRGWKKFKSNKIAELTYASIQGIENLINKFKKSSVMTELEEYRPRVYYSEGPMKGKERDVFLDE